MEKMKLCKPDIVSRLKGTFSLGTNVCGHETNIKKPAKPFHVIVYDENFEIERKKKKKDNHYLGQFIESI